MCCWVGNTTPAPPCIVCLAHTRHCPCGLKCGLKFACLVGDHSSFQQAAQAMAYHASAYMALVERRSTWTWWPDVAMVGVFLLRSHLEHVSGGLSLWQGGTIVSHLKQATVSGCLGWSEHWSSQCLAMHSAHLMRLSLHHDRSIFTPPPVCNRRRTSALVCASMPWEPSATALPCTTRASSPTARPSSSSPTTCAPPSAWLPCQR